MNWIDITIRNLKFLSSLFCTKLIGIVQVYLKKKKLKIRKIKSAETSKVFMILKRVYCSKIYGRIYT